MEFDFAAGIDFGSKLAGTTVIAVAGQKTIRLFSSRKNEDADQFLMEIVKDKGIRSLFIDAPLSLPGVYFNLENHNDYFYRKADQQLHAMSPMFIGGLTARAMKICGRWSTQGIKCTEVYPAAFASRMKWEEKGYKKEEECLPDLAELASDIIGLPLPHDLASWHELDALIALAIGKLYLENKTCQAGNPEEGLIYF